ncbi:MAG: hypothetical protein ACSHXK_10280 [Oceanococcus sp.]
MNETVAANRTAAALSGIILAIVGSACLATLLFVRSVPTPTVVALALGLSILFALPVIMMLRAKEHAYPIVRAWVVIAGCMIAGQIVNYLFGPEQDSLLQRGWPPLLTIGIPLFLLIARVFLIKGHAHFTQWSFLAVLAASSALHWFLYAAQAQTIYGMALLAVTVWLLGPLIILLLDLQLRVQGTAYRAVQVELLNLQRKQNAERQLHMVDNLTGLLNQEGVQESLEMSLAGNTLTGLAGIRILNANNIRQFCEPGDFETMMREIAAELKLQAGHQLMAGLWDEASFVMWGEITESKQQWSERIDDVALRVENIFSDGHLLPDIQMATHVAAHGESLESAIASLSLQ